MCFQWSLGRRQSASDSLLRLFLLLGQSHWCGHHRWWECSHMGSQASRLDQSRDKSLQHTCVWPCSCLSKGKNQPLWLIRLAGNMQIKSTLGSVCSDTPLSYESIFSCEDFRAVQSLGCPEKWTDSMVYSLAGTSMVFCKQSLKPFVTFRWLQIKRLTCAWTSPSSIASWLLASRSPSPPKSALSRGSSIIRKKWKLPGLWVQA